MMLSDYTAGTISVAADGTEVTGVGTAWEVARFREGDWLIANGWVNVIASVESNTSLTLAQPWRGGELSGASYRLRYMSDGSRASAQARQLIDMLGGSGNLEALGGLVGAPGSIPYFTGPGTMGLLSPQDITQGVHYDVQVDELSDRDAYDGEPEGFAVLISDVGDGRSAIYSRVGAAGTWSDPAYITGPVGPANTLAKGTITTGEPGTDADISITGDAPNQTLNLTIPRGDVGPPNTLIKGTVTTGPAGSDADISITGDAPEQTLNITIPRGDKGEGLAANVSVDELADRDEYDDEPQGFAVLVRDIGNGRAAIFEKDSAATADWSAPAFITGAAGDGDVVGPASATDGAIAVFDGATGKLITDGGATVSGLSSAIASRLPLDGSAAMTGPLVLTEDDAPGTPDAGKVALYAKTDGKLYTKDDDGAEIEVGSGREVLSGDRTYYVRTDGDNANTGLSNTAGGAFKTVQRAVDVAATIDLAGFTVTIQVGPGTYTDPVSLKDLVGGPGVIIGDETTPSNVTLDVTGTCIAADGLATTWDVRGLRLRGTVHGLSVAFGSVLIFQNIDFGTCGAYQIAMSSSIVFVSGNYSISGGALRHVGAFLNSTFQCQSKTVTLTGTPNFGIFFDFNNGSASVANGNTYSGGATGKRYNAADGASIATGGGGANYFPGNAAGTSTTGYYS